MERLQVASGGEHLLRDRVGQLRGGRELERTATRQDREQANGVQRRDTQLDGTREPVLLEPPAVALVQVAAQRRQVLDQRLVEWLRAAWQRHLCE